MTDELKCPFHEKCSNGCPWKTAKENGWLSRQNTKDKIEIWVKELLEQETKVVEQIRNGRKVEKAKGHLVGKIMKDHPGASAQDVKEVIEKLIQKEIV